MPKHLMFLIHVLFWVPHMALEYYLFSRPNMTPEQIEGYWFFNGYSWNVVFFGFYLNYFVLIPYLLLRKKYIIYAVSISIICCSSFLILAKDWSGIEWINILDYPKDLTTLIMFNLTMHLFISTALKMFDYFVTSKKLKQQLKEEISNSELAFLKSQMSPHFLFNTLNNIYSLALDRSPSTKPAIRELNKLMEYIEEFEGTEKASIYKEIEHLNNYISLNKLRYECLVNFNTDINQEIFIEPLILLPFIENAFKHGDVSATSEINISLKVDTTKKLHFSVQNTVNKDKNKDSAGGIGINNITKRLHILYKDKFQLDIKDKDSNYIIDLNLHSIETTN